MALHHEARQVCQGGEPRGVGLGRKPIGCGPDGFCPGDARADGRVGRGAKIARRVINAHFEPSFLELLHGPSPPALRD